MRSIFQEADDAPGQGRSKNYVEAPYRGVQGYYTVLSEGGTLFHRIHVPANGFFALRIGVTPFRVF